MTLDGGEIINVARTETYMSDRHWFAPLYAGNDLRVMLGDDVYVSPKLDPAPWFDPTIPESEDFYGFYPLDTSGYENSTRGSTVQESTIDGGNSGRLRHGTKSVVFNGLLFGATDAAVNYGMEWLKRALLGNVCSDRLVTTQSVGVEMAYLSGPPVLNPSPSVSPTTTLFNLTRKLHRMVVNNGPTITSKAQELSCGGSMWSVQFTGVAGNAFEYSAERPIIAGYMDPTVSNPWVPGVIPGTYSTSPTSFVEVACGDDTWQPIFDPLCPALIAPPPPPSVPLGCYEPETTWYRRKITIPAENIPLWGQVVPTLTAFAPAEIRNLRVRFYPDPSGTNDPDSNPCSFQGDIVFSYIPPGGTLIFDGVKEQVFIITSTGHRRRADSLAFRTDGRPFTWPTLSCGYGHIMTFDLPVGETLPYVDLALTARIY